MNTAKALKWQFLQGGGEMGALTRAYPWESTSIGSPDSWPQSLRTTISIILNGRFPMFLWWGPELLCFYNDAYRPSLGENGKHPYALGKPAEEVWPEIWPVIKPLIDQVMTGGPATWMEDQLIPIYRNGRLEDVYWTFSYSPVRDETSKVAGVLVTCTETTEKVKQLTTIEETKNQLQFAIDAAELGAWELNLQTWSFQGNNRLKEWFGLSHAAEVPVDHAISMVAADDRLKVKESINLALDPASGGQYDVTFTVFHPKTHEERIIRSIGRATFNEKQVACRFNGILLDMTSEVKARQAVRQAMLTFSRELERQVAERTAELAASNQQLRRTNLELEQFAYIASHDLQEPLRKVRVFTSMLKTAKYPSQELIDKIETSTARMGKLIQDVLNYSGLNAPVEKFKPIDLEQLLEDIRTDFELLITEKEAIIQHNKLPVIEGITLQITQLFSNLISNALKFSDPARIPYLRITAENATNEELANHPELRSGKQYCLITFKDNGIGFMQEHAEQIFNIFQRLHSRDAFSGTGIGLALCKKIVLNHHGSISVTAVPGEGATFKVLLPYKQ